MELIFLKKLAYKSIISSRISEIPIDPQKICDELGISINAFEQENKLSILRNSKKKSILVRTYKKSTIYYDKSLYYKNYLIFSEISKYLLKECGEKNINRKDADILSLLLMAPPLIINKTKKYSVLEIMDTFKIPAHLVRMNFDIFEDKSITEFDATIMKNFKSSIHKKSIRDRIFDKAVEASTKLMEKGLDDPDPKLDNVRHEISEGYRISHIVYMDDQTHIYHEWDCPHIQDKIDISADCIANAEKKEYSPCPDCIRKLK